MVKVIGHRGARDLWAENSLFGFKALLGLPVDGVEFDLHLTHEGEMLVIHDPVLDRTTNRSGPVAALGRGEHRIVNLVGGEGLYIPSFSEVLDLFADTALELHVELKVDAQGVPYRGLVAKAAAMLDAYGVSGRAILTSFDPDILAEVSRVAPHIPTLCSFDAGSAERLGLLAGLASIAESVDVIAVERTLLDRNWEAITGIVPAERLGVWVPNEQADLAFWLERPLRQLTTDRPDRAVQINAALAERQ